MTNYCHLSYEDRKNIEDTLNQNKFINKISDELSRDSLNIKSPYETILFLCDDHILNCYYI